MVTQWAEVLVRRHACRSNVASVRLGRCVLELARRVQNGEREHRPWLNLAVIHLRSCWPTWTAKDECAARVIEARMRDGRRPKR